MLDFLSDVLEFDVDLDSHCVSHGNFLFKFSDNDTHLSNTSAGVEFNFQVEKLSQLEEIARKYNFFLYRKPSTHTFLENITFTELDSRQILTIEDLDRRIWRFEFSASI